MGKAGQSSAWIQDLAKAFDMVDHSIIVGQLRSIGVSERSLGWFANYLSLRSAVYKVRKSAVSATACHQGSILGDPRIFLLNALQLSFHSVQQAFSALNLVLNTSKTKVMWFGKKNAPRPTGVITTSEGLELEVVTSYKYLGYG